MFKYFHPLATGLCNFLFTVVIDASFRVAGEKVGISDHTFVDCPDVFFQTNRVMGSIVDVR